MDIRNNEEISDYVNLFVSILICFPEVGTIKFDRDSQELYITFILRNTGVSKRMAVDFGLLRVDMALRQYHRMEKTIHYDYQVNVHHLGEYSVIEIKRDMKTVTRAEISFLVELYRTEFHEHLIMESVDHDDVQNSDFYDNVIET
ncbi:MAG: hypothetical protein U0M15_09430, partial [Bacillota bacterium]|nr:hypothetical protein [Bacillota bacterium]